MMGILIVGVASGSSMRLSNAAVIVHAKHPRKHHDSNFLLLPPSSPNSNTKINLTTPRFAAD
jgi:hypothetical protein